MYSKDRKAQFGMSCKRNQREGTMTPHAQNIFRMCGCDTNGRRVRKLRLTLSCGHSSRRTSWMTNHRKRLKVGSGMWSKTEGRSRPLLSAGSLTVRMDEGLRRIAKRYSRKNAALARPKREWTASG